MQVITIVPSITTSINSIKIITKSFDISLLVSFFVIISSSFFIMLFKQVGGKHLIFQTYPIYNYNL